MTLYQEIIWLKTFFKGKWVIENVKPYYKPLIQPDFTMERHCYWASDFILAQADNTGFFTDIRDDIHAMAKAYGYNLSDLKEIDVRKALRNAVRPQDGLFIFQKIMGR